MNNYLLIIRFTTNLLLKKTTINLIKYTIINLLFITLILIIDSFRVIFEVIFQANRAHRHL